MTTGTTNTFTARITRRLSSFVGSSASQGTPADREPPREDVGIEDGVGGLAEMGTIVTLGSLINNPPSFVRVLN